MSNSRVPSTDTSTLTTDSSTSTEQIVQPSDPPPVSDSFTGTVIGDSSISEPVIINR